jgi:site-specific DNA-methyltransferase (cytosine-N4-specific)
MRNVVLYGPCLTRLKEVPEGSVQMCVTSPPYWGLRDYGTAVWNGGDPSCDHNVRRWEGPNKAARLAKKLCICGAVRLDSQLGLEATPQEYAQNLVAILAEVRRVLRSDGTLWLNLGDTYISARGMSKGVDPKQQARRFGLRPNDVPVPGYQQKELAGIPWEVAFALRKDGWRIRAEVIWHKPNVTPESVGDRVTRAHEHVFHLTKSRDYYYNPDAILEPFVGDAPKGKKGRNKRSVWSIHTQPYKGAHFAVMPPELASTCIRASSKPGDLVLDPFAGSGTTLEVAKDLGRDYIGIELNEEYRTLIEERVNPAAKYMEPIE